LLKGIDTFYPVDTFNSFKAGIKIEILLEQDL